MRYKKTKNNNFASFLSSIVIIMLVVLIVGYLFVRTDGLTTGYKEFYVKYGTDTILGDRDNFTIVVGRDYRFDIVSDKNNVFDTESNYFVSISPNNTSLTAFAFGVNGVSKNYADISSLTNCFNIAFYEDYFVLRADYDLCDMLKDLYHTENITNCPTTINSDISYYTLKITSVDNADAININFNLKSE